MPTLDKWYVQQDAEGDVVEPFFPYFYLDGKTMKARWLRDMPAERTWTQVIKWTGLNSTVTLVANIPEPDDVFPRFDFPTEEYYSNVPYLKSHLQKCIRRSNLALALKTALHLARLDFQALIRRLGIIVIEDVQLIPEYSTLVWLTAATSKGFALDRKRIYWIFGLITKLALHTTREPALGTEYDTSYDSVDGAAGGAAGTGAGAELDLKGWRRWKLYKLDDEEKGIIQSILLRESYGGMTGDKAMLVRTAHNWLQRFLKNKQVDVSQEMDPYLRSFQEDTERSAMYYVSPPEENLEIRDWIIPAVDFHCVSNMIMILVDKYEDYEYADIKEAIWHHSSKWTNKKSHQTKRTEHDIVLQNQAEKKTAKVWAKIRPEFYGLASYFLKNNY